MSNVSEAKSGLKRILFVDDDKNVLQGLRRMLRPMRKEWHMEFVDSGEHALEAMEPEPFDVVVSDMRMPGMDGGTLLDKVMHQYPDTIRFALSGQSDRETIFRSIGPTHQFLAKPCEAQELQRILQRAFMLRDLLSSEHLVQWVSEVNVLPTLPKCYHELVQELRSPEADISVVARTICKDAAMAAKVLQWVNSAFFGLRQEITTVEQAVAYLGLDTIRALVMTIGVFSDCRGSKRPAGWAMESLMAHSLTVAACAREIAKREGLNTRQVAECFTAGLLHDVGELVLAANAPEEFAQAMAATREAKRLPETAERKLIGAAHSEVGAYLLGLWGLPDCIVEAIAFHHDPAKMGDGKFSPLMAVNAAEALSQDHSASHDKIKVDYLAEHVSSERLRGWRDACLHLEQITEEQ